MHAWNVGPTYCAEEFRPNPTTLTYSINLNCAKEAETSLIGLSLICSKLTIFCFVSSFVTWNRLDSNIKFNDNSFACII